MTQHGRATYISWGPQVLEVLEIDSGGLAATTETIDHTKYGTSYREFAPGYTDPGSLTVTVTTDNDAVNSQLRTMWELQTVAPLSVVLPTGLQLTANAFITQFIDSIVKTGLYTLKITFKLSGKPGREAYSLYQIVPPTNTTLYRGASYSLHLSGSGGTDPAGGNAVFGFSGSHDGSTITGNLLTIDKTATEGTITVTATVTSDPPTPSPTIAPVTYNIVAPRPSTLSIAGRSYISQKQEDGTKTYQYSAVVYPTGAVSTATWKAYIYKDTRWVEADDDTDHISMNNGTGELTVKAGYIGADIIQLRINCVSTAVPALADEKYVTLEITED